MLINVDGAFEFSFKRTPAVIKAYGEEFTLPVRNAEFLDRLIAADKKILTSKTGSLRAAAYREGISAFIGEDAAAKIFPDTDTADIDEMQAFYEALAEAVKQKSAELIKAKYSDDNIQ